MGGHERGSRSARVVSGVLTSGQSAASVARFQAALDARGWGWWAVEVRATGGLIGLTGLDPVDDGPPFSGAETGWRLARTTWSHGAAMEAAEATVDFGFAAWGGVSRGASPGTQPAAQPA